MIHKFFQESQVLPAVILSNFFNRSFSVSKLNAQYQPVGPYCNINMYIFKCL